MDENRLGEGPDQPDLFETEEARSLLDQLQIDSQLYKTSKNYKELLDFVVRLRNFAPDASPIAEARSELGNGALACC